MTTNSTITPELLDQLLANDEKAEDLSDDGLFKQLKKALIERALGRSLPSISVMRRATQPDAGAAKPATAHAQKPY